MYDAHERILQKLAESGQKEFSTEMITDAMNKIEEEDLDVIHAQWLKDEEARYHEEAQWRADENTLDRIERSYEDAQMQPPSWEEIEEDFSTFPELKDNHDMDMEL